MGKGGDSAYFEDFEVGAAEHAQNGGEHSCGLLEGEWIISNYLLRDKYCQALGNEVRPWQYLGAEPAPRS